MNYKIIKDEIKFKEFIDWLPELKLNEVYYIVLFARGKYFPASYPYKVPDQNVLKRFTSEKDFLFQKVKQLEVEFGSYTMDGHPVPDDALALYIGINPKNMVDAVAKLSIELTRTLVDLLKNPETKVKPQSELMTVIAKSGVKTMIMDYDFDGVGYDEVKADIQNVINDDACKVLSTRGGFHLLVELSKIDVNYKKGFHQGLLKIKGADQSGGRQLTPVAGCTQGGYMPHFIESIYVGEVEENQQLVTLPYNSEGILIKVDEDPTNLLPMQVRVTECPNSLYNLGEVYEFATEDVEFKK